MGGGSSPRVRLRGQPPGQLIPEGSFVLLDLTLKLGGVSHAGFDRDGGHLLKVKAGRLGGLPLVDLAGSRVQPLGCLPVQADRYAHLYRRFKADTQGERFETGAEGVEPVHLPLQLVHFLRARRQGLRVAKALQVVGQRASSKQVDQLLLRFQPLLGLNKGFDGFFPPHLLGLRRLESLLGLSDEGTGLCKGPFDAFQLLRQFNPSPAQLHQRVGMGGSSLRLCGQTAVGIPRCLGCTRFFKAGALLLLLRKQDRKLVGCYSKLP